MITTIPKKMIIAMVAILLVLSVLAMPSQAADETARSPLMDWRDISYEKDPRYKPKGSWELTYGLSSYLDDLQNFNRDFESDNFHLFRVRYRHSNRISKSFEQFFRYDLTRKWAFKSSIDSYTRYTAVAGLRYRFKSGARLDLPVDVNFSDYASSRSKSTNVNIGFSPDVRLPFGEGHTFRFRTDMEVTRYPDDHGRDNLILRLRPTWYFNPDGPYSVSAGLYLERRVARRDFNSRRVLGANFAVVRELENSDNFWDFAMSYTDTLYDDHRSAAFSPLHTRSLLGEIGYNWKSTQVQGLSLTAGLGYEFLDSVNRNTTSESPYLVFFINRRF